MKKIEYIAPEMETIEMQSNMTLLAGSGDGAGSIVEQGGELGGDSEW